MKTKVLSLEFQKIKRISNAEIERVKWRDGQPWCHGLETPQRPALHLLQPAFAMLSARPREGKEREVNPAHESAWKQYQKKYIKESETEEILNRKVDESVKVHRSKTHMEQPQQWQRQRQQQEQQEPCQKPEQWQKKKKKKIRIKGEEEEEREEGEEGEKKEKEEKPGNPLVCIRTRKMHTFRLIIVKCGSGNSPCPHTGMNMA